MKIAGLFLSFFAIWAINCAPANLSSAGFPDLTQAEAIQIKTDWTGLSPDAPIERHYSLKRGEKGFTGRADFSRGGYRGAAQKSSQEIEIPLAAAESFLQKLQQLPLAEGAYKPKIEHTDDYPSLSIELTVKGEIVRIFSQSQGKDNVPWGASYKGKSYVINSALPAEALAGLQTYLKENSPGK